MPTSGAGTASSSVSPKAIVPSITVISLLVLIIFIGAVIIFVHAYRKRRRGQSNIEKQNEEARLSVGVPGERYQERSGNVLRKGRPNDTISSLPRTARRQSRRIPPQEDEAREVVDQGLHRGRCAEKDGIGRAVVTGKGYNLQCAHENGGAEIRKSTGIFTVPVVGKIERITGNSLSNDFYTERASGSGHSRSNSSSTVNDFKRHSYPVLNTINLPQRSPSFKHATFELDTNMSPILLETDISTARDFSPNDEHSGLFRALSPPPAAPAPIAFKYPNVSALMRGNAPVEEPQSKRSPRRSSNRSSYTPLYGGTYLADHISPQYYRVRERRQGPDPGLERADALGRIIDPPLSAAVEGFGISKSLSHSSVRSHGSTDTTVSTEPLIKDDANRIPWNGRSVLELDPIPPSPGKRSSPPPLVPTIKSQFHPLRRETRNLPVGSITPPKPAAVPRVFTSAFGPYSHRNYPLLPPLHPDPEDIAGNPSQQILPALMSRSGSASKASVVSVPSTISSFNTTTGGLSPAPAWHSLRDISDQFEDTFSIRRSPGTNTVLTETSQASNSTVVELELEMRRIRERARRASEERRVRRKWNEDRQGSRRVLRGGDKPGVGHRLL